VRSVQWAAAEQAGERTAVEVGAES
jgi:hypothetical protein